MLFVSPEFAEVSDLEDLFEAVDMFDDVQCDLALPSDLHVVGVAMRLGESQDEEIRERRLRSRRKRRQSNGAGETGRKKGFAAPVLSS